MPQLPALSNLRLGAPIAGKQSRRKAEKERVKAERDEAAEDSMTLMANHDHRLVFLYMNRAKRHFGLNAFDAVDVSTHKAINWFLQDIAEDFFKKFLLKPDGFLPAFLEFEKRHRERGDRAHRLVLRMAEYRDKMMARMASFVWTMTVHETDKPGEPQREISEVNRIINEPDVLFLYKRMGAALFHFFHRTGARTMSDPLEIPDDLKVLLTSIMHLKMAEENSAQAAAPRAPRPAPPAPAPPAPTPAPPKSRAEYDRNVQAAKDREAQEAAARLAEQRARDAMIARERDAAAREQTRLEQEREDALVQQLERASLAGSSRDHAQQAPLSPASQAKRLADAEKAREAKQQDIAETKARIKEQKAVQAAKDAEEAKEQDRRAEARDTAKRIAHGEGYSKRQGNRE